MEFAAICWRSDAAASPANFSDRKHRPSTDCFVLLQGRMFPKWSRYESTEETANAHLPPSHRTCREAAQCNLPPRPFPSSLRRACMSRRRNGLPHSGLQVARGAPAQTHRSTLVAQHVALVHRREQRPRQHSLRFSTTTSRPAKQCLARQTSHPISNKESRHDAREPMSRRSRREVTWCSAQQVHVRDRP